MAISSAIADYAATAGAVADGLPEPDQRQEGDPDKTAAAVLATAGRPGAPLRLARGPDAIPGLRGTLARVAANLHATAELGSNTGFS